MGKIITLPFAALLRWMYTLTGSYGVAIIMFSLILKLILLPFQMKSKRSMVHMGRLDFIWKGRSTSFRIRLNMMIATP